MIEAGNRRIEWKSSLPNDDKRHLWVFNVPVLLSKLSLSSSLSLVFNFSRILRERKIVCEGSKVEKRAPWAERRRRKSNLENLNIIIQWRSIQPIHRPPLSLFAASQTHVRRENIEIDKLLFNDVWRGRMSGERWERKV